MKRHKVVMNKIFKILFFILILFDCISLSAVVNKLKDDKTTNFPISEVRLLDSPFKHAMEKDLDWLLSLNPDRLMSGFLENAKLPIKAPKYGGWESDGVAGHTLGHYLSACSMMYASTGDSRMKSIVDYCIEQLAACQQQTVDGMLAGFPDASRFFSEISQGKIYSKGFDLNGYWVPLYTMHKLFAGLIDAFYYTDNVKAKEVLIKLSHFLNKTLGHLSDEQLQTILDAEHGGINESLAEVYAITKDTSYLYLAERLNHKKIMEPLLNRVDSLAGLHANTQIPKIIGVMREYELTGKLEYLDIADFFWTTVVNHHSYVIGGNSEAEHFGVPDRTCDRLTDKTCETCNSYNMLKLTRHLFNHKLDVKKVDYYERVLYNHILASQNPDNGMVCYMSPLASGCKKEFSTPFESFWCCVGTGLENHAKYGEFIYSKDASDNLYVNLFIPSSLNWKKRGVQVTQKTAYPLSDSIRLDLQMDKEQEFTVHLRFPSWAKLGCKIYVNGKLVESNNATPGSYLSINRKWRNGDILEYVLPQSITSEEIMGDSSLKAYLYGPLVLAGSLKSSVQEIPVALAKKGESPVRVELKNGTPSFTLKNAWPESIELKPYYQVVNEYTVVYFEHFTPEEWKVQESLFLQKRDMENWIKKHTVSEFRPGEMQPERDHAFDGQALELGEMQGKKYRKAMGGFFSFDMNVTPDVPMDLMCTYWGDLGSIYKFKIYVEDVSIATVIIHWWGAKFIDKVYKIPSDLTKGKQKVRVTFRALDKASVAGPLFNCKMLKTVNH